MTATIRPAAPADAPALGAIHSASWGELYPKSLPPEVLAQLNPAYMVHLWTKFIAKGDPYRQWVAEVDGTAVGFIGVGPGREEDTEHLCEIYFFYVVPEARDSGVGSQLLEAADADYVWVWEEFKRTRKFYADKGFHPEIVRATRGRGPRTRVGVLFGSAYQTEFKLIRAREA
jgi:GNAT superfamily N-acetyltransferase